MPFGLDLTTSDLVIEFGIAKVVHFRIKRFDFARGDPFSQGVV
jgi:hypothetical protein